MQNFYLIDYLRRKNTLSPELMDSLKADLDQHIYYYGNHFKYPKERLSKNKLGFVSQLKRDLFFALQMFKHRNIDHSKKTILSNAYFTVNNELRYLNYNVFSPSWWMASDRIVLTTPQLYQKSEDIRKKLQTYSYFELLSPAFLNLIADFQQKLEIFYKQKQISALIVPNDISFFENLGIHLCRKNSIPSFIFLHGIPGRYNIIDENRTDYLIVWGEKIKENYVNIGFNPAKIYVSGHPFYKSIPDKKLSFSLENILVLTKSMNGGQHSEDVILGDRGNSILYLLQIQNALKELGVKKVRYRPHPCENPIWYQKFIDPDFFVLDNAALDSSLKQSSLVIGPSSTVMIESLYYGVNYVLFEPNHIGIDLFNYPLVAPFDGKDNKVPLAHTESDLIHLIKNRTLIDASFLKDYIQTPFNLDFIKNLI